MLKYVAKRLWETIPTTIGILLLTFVLFNVVGGSPAQVVLGKNATAEAVSVRNFVIAATSADLFTAIVFLISLGGPEALGGPV